MQPELLELVEFLGDPNYLSRRLENLVQCQVETLSSTIRSHINNIERIYGDSRSSRICTSCANPINQITYKIHPLWPNDGICQQCELVPLCLCCERPAHQRAFYLLKDKPEVFYRKNEGWCGKPLYICGECMATGTMDSLSMVNVKDAVYQLYIDTLNVQLVTPSGELINFHPSTEKPAEDAPYSVINIPIYLSSLKNLTKSSKNKGHNITEQVVYGRCDCVNTNQKIKISKFQTSVMSNPLDTQRLSIHRSPRSVGTIPTNRLHHPLYRNSSRQDSCKVYRGIVKQLYVVKSFPADIIYTTLIHEVTHAYISLLRYQYPIILEEGICNALCIYHLMNSISRYSSLISTVSFFIDAMLLQRKVTSQLSEYSADLMNDIYPTMSQNNSSCDTYMGKILTKSCLFQKSSKPTILQLQYLKARLVLKQRLCLFKYRKFTTLSSPSNIISVILLTCMKEYGLESTLRSLHSYFNN